jgi:phage antirepressor YoqD-like protein
MSNQALAVLNSTAMSMSSREIADLTGKRHPDVKRDIEKMLADLAEDVSSFARIYLDSMNRQQTEYDLDRELTETLLTGYSAPLRRKVIARWRELETAATVPALPDFTNPAIAARAWADQVEAKQIALAQLEAAKPSIEFVGRYVESTGSKGFRQVCKLLAANESDFREFLLDKKIMYRLGGEWMPYADHLDAGRFEVKAGTSEVSNHAFNQAKFTTKGVSWVAGEWAKYRLFQQAA